MYRNDILEYAKLIIASPFKYLPYLIKGFEKYYFVDNYQYRNLTRCVNVAVQQNIGCI